MSKKLKIKESLEDTLNSEKEEHEEHEENIEEKANSEEEQNSEHGFFVKVRYIIGAIIRFMFTIESDIINMTKEVKTMLKVFGVTEWNTNKTGFQKSLEIYPELLSDPHCRNTLRDIKNKLEISGLKKQQSDLKAMEQKLDKLLSDDKKTELELDDIAALLKFGK